MASNESSPQTTTPSPSSSNTVVNPLSSHNTLISINVAAQAPLKLTSSNYLSWRAQFESLLVGYDLMGYLDGTLTCPSPILTENGPEKVNPSYSPWIRQDKLLLSAILASLSDTIIPFIASAKTSREAWSKLGTMYAKPSRGRVMGIKDKLAKLSQDTQSVTEYMQIVKRYADELTLIDAPLNDEDLVIHVLNGLGSDFKEISAAVRARDSPISFEELHEKLCDHETFLKREPQRSETPITANVTTKSSHNGKTYTQNHQGRSNNFGNNQYNQSHYSNNRRNHNPKPYRGFCQLCDQQGHTAKRCPRLRTFSPSPPPYQQFGTLSRTPSAPPRAHFAAQPNLASTNWLVDSGASHHVTADLNNLSLHSEYDGSDDIMIGDGTGLQITHTGSTKLPSSSKSFLLSDVLCVPRMQKNLISVSKFCKANHVSIEFFPFDFVVKDLRTRAPLMKGANKDGVYEWPARVSPSSKPIIAFASVKAPLQQWHNRLGHPSTTILKHIISSQTLPLSSSTTSDFSCNACSCNKIHKLPFHVSSLKSTAPLELLYSDVWGPSPIKSYDGFQYYVIFVDHFTKYIWLFPIKLKSDVSSVFTRFKQVVEKFFQKPIISIYSDCGGEFTTLKSFLETHGITHFFTPPHTPEHNGTAERRHRHVRETGLTLLSQASLPLQFWSHAFLTAVYLINRMPTPILSLQSPFAKLFGRPPNYTKLRVFGCLCYPWLKPYTKHKLEPRSRPCVFLGYSPTQSVYKCLDPTTHRIFISRHVNFVENIFPYSSLDQNSTRVNSLNFSPWTSHAINAPSFFAIPIPDSPIPSTSDQLSSPQISPIPSLSQHSYSAPTQSSQSSVSTSEHALANSPTLSSPLNGSFMREVPPSSENSADPIATAAP
jgi:hypothetical protein